MSDSPDVMNYLREQFAKVDGQLADLHADLVEIIATAARIETRLDAHIAEMRARPAP